MLYNVQHVEIGQVEEYLKVDQETLNSIEMIQQGETNQVTQGLNTEADGNMDLNFGDGVSGLFK